MLGPGEARSGTAGAFKLVVVPRIVRSWRGVARPGKASRGKAGLGMARAILSWWWFPRIVAAGLGKAGRGKARPGRSAIGKAGQGFYLHERQNR